jgi:hypothetical protein
VNSLIMPLRCPKCAAKVKMVNVGDPVDGGTNINAVLRCTRQFCRTEFSLHIHIMSMGTYSDEGVAHGTSKAFARHRELGERLCDACKDYNTRRFQDSNKPREMADA